jgi:hypothetical protein
MGALATDKNPASPDRQLIYYADQPAACGSSSISQNRVFINKIIYYVKNESLWRRVIVPPYNTNTPSDLLTICGDPWQQNSCSPGYTLTPPCQANDSEVMKNVQSFAVKYYDSPSATNELTGTDILAATTIDVTITGAKTTTGKATSTSGTVRASKLNSIEADIPPPTTPLVSHIVGDSPRPNVGFSWAAVQHATSYKVSYTINGGTPVNLTLPASTTYQNVTANRTDTIDFEVSSVNSSGESPDANDSATLPPWTEVDPMNDWVSYNTNVFASPGYTITPDSVVVLKGLIKDGVTTSNTPIFNLPPGYRPERKLIFIVGSFGNPGSGTGRIDVLPNGDVLFVSGTDGWISLDSIHFLPQSASYSWTKLALPNTDPGQLNLLWRDYMGDYSQLQVTKDASGRAHVHGLVRSGNAASGQVIDALPANYQPAGVGGVSEHLLFPGMDTGTTFSAFGVYNTNNIVARGLYSSYISIQAMYYPLTATTTWKQLGTGTAYTQPNGSVYYGEGSGHSKPQYTKKDGIVTVKGLIKGGNMANGQIIGQLDAGFRPKKKLIFPALGAAVAGNGGHTRIDVAPSGAITIEGGIAATTYLSLDSISFIAEQ